MATILRPTKVGGTRLYTTEVQNGFDLIREDEVDHDFNIVYGEFNGGIDNDNILVPPHTGPRIEYVKLDLFHKLKGSDFDPTNTDPIPPTFFPPGGTTGIPGTAIQDHTIGPLQLWNPAAGNAGIVTTTPPGPFVTSVGNLALGSSCQSLPQTAYREDNFLVGAMAATVETTWTSRGGPVLILGTMNYQVTPVISSGVSGGFITVQLTLDGTPGGAADGTVLLERTASVTLSTTPTAALISIPVHFSLPWWGISTFFAAGPTPPVHRLKLVTGITSTVTTDIHFSHLDSSISVVELG